MVRTPLLQVQQDRLVDEAARLLAADRDDGQSEDTEEDFNPRHARDRSDSLYFGSQAITDLQVDGNEDKWLDAVEGAVHDFNQKFDCLLASLSGGATRTTKAPPPASWGRHARVDTEVDPALPRAHTAAGPASTAPNADHAHLRLLQALQGRDSAPVPRPSDFRGPHYDNYIRDQIRKGDCF